MLHYHRCPRCEVERACRRAECGDWYAYHCDDCAAREDAAHDAAVRRYEEAQERPATGAEIVAAFEASYGPSWEGTP